MRIVERTSCGVTFKTVDPDSLPYGMNTFEDEAEIKNRFWVGFRPGHHAVDVGASWGSHTLPALAYGAHVTAFEPSDQGCEVIRQSAAANDFTSRLAVHKAVLWDGTPYPEWMEREIFATHYPVGARPEYRTLDSYELQGVSHIKVDVEGAELGFLRGAVDTIMRCRPFLLIEDHSNVYPWCAENRIGAQVISLLGEWQYRVSCAPYLGRNFIIGRAA